MHILLALAVGVCVGLAAHALMGRVFAEGREAGGWIGSVLTAAAGAMLGGFLGRAFGMYAEGNSEPMSSVFSVVVACMFVAAHQILTRRGLRRS